MNHVPLFSSLVLLLTSLTVAPVWADIYHCTDAAGRVLFQTAPCADGSAPVIVSPERPPTLAEQFTREHERVHERHAEMLRRQDDAWAHTTAAIHAGTTAAYTLLAGQVPMTYQAQIDQALARHLADPASRRVSWGTPHGAVVCGTVTARNGYGAWRAQVFHSYF